MKKRIQMLAAGALAAALLIGFAWTALQNGPATVSAAEPLARGAEAAANLESIHIKLRMRHAAGRQFSKYRTQGWIFRHRTLGAVQSAAVEDRKAAARRGDGWPENHFTD